jgi:hypothetical protein
VITLGTIGYSLVWATWLDLNFIGLAPSLASLTFPVQFIGWWNNYAGSLIFKTDRIPVNQTIQFWDWNTVNCKAQLRWYYFNAARGAGLLPLSSLEQSNDWVTVSWGLYTLCGGWSRLFDLVWMLDYRKSGADIGKVVFWVETDIPNNSSNGHYEASAISRKVSNWVNGKFFDTMFGIGQVATDNSTGTGWIWSVSNLIGTFTNIYIQGHVGIGQSVEESEREILTINLAWTKTLLTSTDEILASTVINTVEKNRAKQCRNNAWNNKFICTGEDWIIFVLDADKAEEFANKDVVFEKWDVFIDDSVYTWYQDNRFKKSLSIYVANGNLILDSSIQQNNLTPVDNNWFYTSNTSTTNWIYLVGNFITNWIILWAMDAASATLWTYTSIPFKTFIHGKFTSLNTFTTVSAQREKLLRTLIDTRNPSYDDISTNQYLWKFFSTNKWNAGMWEIFARRCADTTITWSNGQTGWMGAYPIMPANGFDTSTINSIRSIQCPAWHRYPLMIIEKNIPTLFFNK